MKTIVMAWPAFRNASENPYNKLLSEALEFDGFTIIEFSVKSSLIAKYDLLHIHWPDALLKNVPNFKRAVRLLILFFTLSWIRIIRRKPVVWTVHNVQPHGSDVPEIFNRFLRYILGVVVSHQIHLNSGTASSLARVAPSLSRCPHTVIPHGRYLGEYSVRSSTSQARERLGLHNGEVVVGFVGTIASYKGALEFCRAVAEVPRDLELLGLLAGNCREPKLLSDIGSVQRTSPRLHTRLGWLSSEDFADCVAACDVIVLPYKNIENSGSVFVPLELNTPVLVPATSAMLELSANVGEGWVRTYSSDFNADVLRQNVGPAPAGSPDLSEYSWIKISEKTANVYLSVVQKNQKCRLRK